MDRGSRDQPELDKCQGRSQSQDPLWDCNTARFRLAAFHKRLPLPSSPTIPPQPDDIPNVVPGNGEYLFARGGQAPPPPRSAHPPSRAPLRTRAAASSLVDRYHDPSAAPPPNQCPAAA